MMIGLTWKEVQDKESRTELDSHANMCVVGKCALVLSNTGKKADVSPFVPDHDALQQVSIVDAAVSCNCPVTDKECVLMMHDALHVPAMTNNLMPPFIMREAGVIVNSTPKMQVKEPTIEDHSTCFEEQDFRTTLSLWGTFSHFPTTKPTERQLEECEDVCLLTPDGHWNPHQDAHARNEESVVD